MSWYNPFTWGRAPVVQENKEVQKKEEPAIPPGRVSEPETLYGGYLASLKGMTKLVTPTFRTDLIPLIRDLYKINPDVNMALQDMFKLANTGHTISFPNNTPDEARKMKEHLKEASKNWSRYTAGIDGLVNKFLVQCYIGGAISIEAVPNKDLNGISTILFIKPETIRFKRLKNGVYHPYQMNPNMMNGKPQFIKLNTTTYVYAGMYNDTDEPYGVPPFLAALDSLEGQREMQINFKHIMEMVGMVGFLEAKMAKPSRRANESDSAYSARLQSSLRQLKKNLKDGLKDGIVAGYIDDHEFKLNSTTKEISNLQVPWGMNQQSVANGLGVSGNILGLSGANTEGGSGVLLSKMISQLKNMQMLVSYVLEFIYNLELRLAGLPNKGVEVSFGTSTISDEVKVQQGREYKIRNLVALYTQGIINQDQFAWEMGYNRPAEDEPLVPLNPVEDGGTINDSAKKQKREQDKDASDRKGRDKAKAQPKRHDQDTRKR